MLAAIHQPNLFPRLSTVAKIFMADRWVVLDNVQFVRRDYQHRCRLAALTDPSRQQWLSLSVHLSQGQATAINQVRIVDRERCRRRMLGLLQQYYGRSSHWRPARSSIQAVLDLLAMTDSLAEVAEVSGRVLLDLLGWTGEIMRSSELPARTGRSERLADLTRAMGCTEYLYGTGGARYLDIAPFTRLGLTARPFEPPPALRPPTSMRRVSALWALMTIGPTALRDQLDRWSARTPGAA
jgi:WbqC-like protein family